ncbi:MAG: GIY-YIG nuclease family protein [Bacteroidetes bacterium]|nr:MAG: GIY-YIG nuclease family protein [Bacteroidota bacterium]
MKYLLYILYSPTLNKYYIGYTGDDMEERLRRRNSRHKGYTGKVNDWRVVYQEVYSTKKEAYHREREIKGWKSRKRIERLIKGLEHPG